MNTELEKRAEEEWELRFSAATLGSSIASMIPPGTRETAIRLAIEFAKAERERIWEMALSFSTAKTIFQPSDGGHPRSLIDMDDLKRVIFEEEK